MNGCYPAIDSMEYFASTISVAWMSPPPGDSHLGRPFEGFAPWMSHAVGFADWMSLCGISIRVSFFNDIYIGCSQPLGFASWMFPFLGIRRLDMLSWDPPRRRRSSSISSLMRLCSISSWCARSQNISVYMTSVCVATHQNMKA